MNAPVKASLDLANLATFRKLTPEAQLRTLRGQKLERVFAVERAGIDEEKRTCWMSIASDAPYERWWGTEVLDLSPGCIRDARLRMGAPLLVGHDTADQVGVVEDFEITSDKKLRVLARFGRSARAEEIFRDVLDGIRRNTSVGYIIHDLVLQSQEEDVNTYRVTDWEPLEGSLVPVPADPSVGVGRNHGPAQAGPPPQRKTTMTPEEKAAFEAELRAKIEAENKAKADAEALARSTSPAEVLRREQERVKGILDSGDQYANMGGVEIAKELVKDPSATQDTFKARMLERTRGRTPPIPTAQPADLPSAFGSGVRVQYQYGKLKAFRDIPIEGGGVMRAEEAAHRAGMWLAAAVYQKDWGQKWCREHGVPFLMRDQTSGEVRVMAGSSLTTGGALVPVEMESAIISLRDQYGVARRLCRVRPMSTDTLVIPRRTGGITAYFFSDDDGTGITASDKSWDQVRLTTKKLGALGKLSRDLVEDAVISVIDDMAQEQAYAFAVKEDNALINGDGTSTYAGIQGLVPKFENTAYASRITAASGHDTWAEYDNADLTSTMAGVSQYAIAGPGAVWLCSTMAKAATFGRLKAIAGGNRVDTLGMPAGDEYLGYPIVTSEAMYATDIDLSSKTGVMFGRFDMAASFGSRRGIEVQTLVERYAELGQIGIVTTERIDIVVHDLGTTAVKGPVAALYGN